MEILEGPNKVDIKKEDTKGFKTPAKDIKKEDTKGFKTLAKYIKKEETKGFKTPANNIGSCTQDPETVWICREDTY